jgi:ABC-2 type transport system permease protein
MRRASLIAAGELRLLARSRLAWLGLGTLLLLALVAAATSWAHVERERAARAAHQHVADELFDAQPDRHPHRMVHYGTYVYRPLGVLSAFDPGVDAYTGTTLYLEGHRQNSASFGAVRESSSLVRFGQLTPAFVLQVLAPLLLVFLGFAGVAREREAGTLAQLRAHGASAADVVLGKGLALGVVALVAAAPALLGLAAAVVSTPVEWPGAATIAAAYLLYLLAWVLAVVAVSALARTGRGALAALVAAWTVAVILVPRVAAELAGRIEPLPLRAETDLRMQAELRALGDGHDPDDPFFAAFRARTLEQYGVDRVEDLPVNFRGLVSAEGEALTSRLFDDYAARAAAVQRAQVAWLGRLGAASPASAVRRVSLAAAGTDLENHLRFLTQAEAHRFDFVQRLNRLHAEGVEFADDARRSRDADAERRTRVAAHHWAALPDFAFTPAPAAERAAQARRPLLELVLWVLAALGLAAWSGRVLERSAR